MSSVVVSHADDGTGHQTSPDETTIGGRIKAVRRKAGLSQEEFARALGYSKRALINWERGVADPSIGLLPRLRRTYDVNLEWLVMGDGTNPDPIGSKRGRTRERALESNSSQLWLFGADAGSPQPEILPPSPPGMLHAVAEHVTPPA